MKQEKCIEHTSSSLNPSQCTLLSAVRFSGMIQRYCPFQHFPLHHVIAVIL